MTELGEVEEAKKRIIDELKIRPTVRGIDRLIDYSLTSAEGETKENLVLLKELTASLLEMPPVPLAIAWSATGH